MTVTFEDDPEISVVEEGGGDLNLPSPSAPDAVTASIIPENRPSLDNLPTATAEVATAMIPNTEAARVPSFVTRPLADGRTGNIERTTQLDGSLSVKVTTITHQPNGYRDMTMEYFHIPSDMSEVQLVWQWMLPVSHPAVYIGLIFNIRPYLRVLAR